MKKFIVTICRTSYGWVDFEIEAESSEEAEAAAMDVAGNEYYTEKDSDYQVSMSIEVKAEE